MHVIYLGGRWWTPKEPKSQNNNNTCQHYGNQRLAMIGIWVSVPISVGATTTGDGGEEREEEGPLNLYKAVLTKALCHRPVIPATDVGFGGKAGKS